MAFTREFIRNVAKESGVEIPKELEDALVQEHIAARDAFAEGKVKTALDANKPVEPVKVMDSAEYKTLKMEYDEYRAEQAKKESRTAKENAYRALLKEAGISERRVESVLRVSDVDSVELDENGAINGADALKKSIQTEWSDFIGTVSTRGADVSNPPRNMGGSVKTRNDIYKKDDKGRYILSASERQAALAESYANEGE